MKRALISVFDKTNVVEFARELTGLGWEIISTGGTSAKFKAEGIPVMDISDLTKFPECFDGRVKTLHPNVEGGILAIRDNETHIAQMNELGIEPIDIVVCNLYPFKETILNPEAGHEEIIENIESSSSSEEQRKLILSVYNESKFTEESFSSIILKLYNYPIVDVTDSKNNLKAQLPLLNLDEYETPSVLKKPDESIFTATAAGRAAAWRQRCT